MSRTRIFAWRERNGEGIWRPDNFNTAGVQYVIATPVDKLIKEVERLCTLSNGVSMAARSPGGRSHSWTVNQIKELYAQQCVVEGVLAELKGAMGEPAAPARPAHDERGWQPS